jgi:hypothetical protein
MSTSAPTLTGHCLCGAVSYRIDAEPVMTIICHCDDCQRSSGSPYSLNVIVPRDALSIEEDGTLATYETTGTDTGEPRERKFCSRCGSTMLTLLNEMPEMAAVKGGTLDDRSSLVPEMEIWAERAHPWIADGAERGVMPRGLPSS